MRQTPVPSRRAFLQATATVAGGGLLAGCKSMDRMDDPVPAASLVEEDPGAPVEISPMEDLMREHGILRRVLLIYEDVARRLDADQAFPAAAIPDASGIIRSFIEDYHEKLEEEFVFPRFRQARRQEELVGTLIRQHREGRRLTDRMMRGGDRLDLKDPDGRRTMAGMLRQFIRMNAPHAAREDTVLFPLFRAIVSASEYDDLGEDFERKESALFGANGFEKMVDRVAAVEKSLGLEDLAQFTAHPSG
jgi:hemerythrin-like domain-containing protein